MKILILTTVLLTAFLPALVTAQVTQTPVQALQGGLNKTVEGTFSTDPATNDINAVIGRIINGAFALLGAVFLLIVITGGLLWMMAGGAEEKVKRAKGFIINGINGLVVIFFSYGLVYIILSGLDRGANSAQ